MIEDYPLADVAILARRDSMAKKKMKKSTRSGTTHLAAALKSNRLMLPEGYSVPDEHDHQDSFTSVREATYRGKAIRVETTYRIMIDGEPVRVHTRVLDDGTVHSHAFPNYSFRSAMDLARKLVDYSTIEIPKNELGEHGAGGGHH